MLFAKANASDVYTKSATYSQSQVNAALATKQNILSVADDSFTAPLINDSTNTIKCLATTSPLTYTDVNDKVTINLDKTALANDFVTVTQLSTLVGTAPQALNTLQELAAALDNDANYAATIQTQLSNKANKSDVYDKATVDDYITDKQDILYVATDPNAASLMDGALDAIKCLATTSPLTYTDTANKITLALDDNCLGEHFSQKYYC